MTTNGPVTWHDFNGLAERVTRLEEKHATESARTAGRTNRIWVVVTLLVSGLVCPVIVTTVIAVFHLRGG